MLIANVNEKTKNEKNMIAVDNVIDDPKATRSLP